VVLRAACTDLLENIDYNQNEAQMRDEANRNEIEEFELKFLKTIGKLND